MALLSQVFNGGKDFMLQIKDNVVAKTVFVDDNEYLI